MTYQFSVRYLVHTGMLRRLAAFCEPVVLLSWHDLGLSALFEAQGADVRHLPEAHYGVEYVRHRRLVEAVHERLLRSPSTSIDHRRRNGSFDGMIQLRRQMRHTFHRVSASLPGARDRILSREGELLRSDTSLSEARAALDGARLDAVLSVTPYHRAEELFLRAAEERGMPLLTSVISFDNPTTRGWIAPAFDHYLVWNRYNKAELLRAYPGLTPDKISITGAPQFDFYADDRWRWDEGSWRQEVGAESDRPVVLFAGGPDVIVPHEPFVVRQIDDAISEGELGDKPLILLRRHPMDPPERWASVVGTCRHVVVSEPWRVHNDIPKYSVPSVRDVERLVSTLAYSTVHVSTSSTMTVDGARLDRPQVGLAYDDRPGRPADRVVRELYDREHWLPIARSGGMVIARSRNALIGGIAEGLRCPEARSHERARLVEEVITYTDGRSTERVVAGVANALGISPAPASGALEAKRAELQTGRDVDGATG